MAISVLVHLTNEDAVMGEVEALPAADANYITVANPRRRDGKDLPYLQPNVSTVIWSIHRISFIEVMPGEAEEKLVTFVRE
ncbi:MAG: hypothetical protein JW929_14935 [Anaerolineales bacterium]|nr:hypothetical protein [Anaerolineales bacterium]